MIAHERPAILVLDEPTNHLDIDMRDALALSLQNYEGALVVVSHDRHMIEAVCDELWVLRGGTINRLAGDLDDYLALQKEATGMPGDLAAVQSTASKKLERQQRASSRLQQSELRKRVKSLEKEMETKATVLAAVETRLADPEIYHGLSAEEMNELLREAAKTRVRLEAIEREWLQAAEDLELVSD